MSMSQADAAILPRKMLSAKRYDLMRLLQFQLRGARSTELMIACDAYVEPTVPIYTATHPLDYRIQRKRLEAAKPISIGCDV